MQKNYDTINTDVKSKFNVKDNSLTNACGAHRQCGLIFAIVAVLVLVRAFIFEPPELTARWRSNRQIADYHADIHRQLFHFKLLLGYGEDGIVNANNVSASAEHKTLTPPMTSSYLITSSEKTVLSSSSTSFNIRLGNTSAATQGKILFKTSIADF